MRIMRFYGGKSYNFVKRKNFWKFFFLYLRRVWLRNGQDTRGKPLTNVWIFYKIFVVFGIWNRNFKFGIFGIFLLNLEFVTKYFWVNIFVSLVRLRLYTLSDQRQISTRKSHKNQTNFWPFSMLFLCNRSKSSETWVGWEQWIIGKYLSYNMAKYNSSCLFVLRSNSKE